MAFGDFLDLSEHAARLAQYRPGDATDIARAKEAVNEGYLQACAGGYPFDFLQQEGTWAVTAGSDTYTYASIGTAISVSGGTIQEIETMVNDTDGYPLRSMSWWDLEKMAASTQDGDSTGAPTHWAKWGNRIRIYPSPDQAYELAAFVRLTPSIMSGDTDTPLIPLHFRRPVICSYAAAQLLRQEDGGEAANLAIHFERKYENDFEKMRMAHATAKLPTFTLKSPTWDQPHGMVSSPWNWTR